MYWSSSFVHAGRFAASEANCSGVGVGGGGGELNGSATSGDGGWAREAEVEAVRLDWTGDTEAPGRLKVTVELVGLRTISFFGRERLDPGAGFGVSAATVVAGVVVAEAGNEIVVLITGEDDVLSGVSTDAVVVAVEL